MHVFVINYLIYECFIGENSFYVMKMKALKIEFFRWENTTKDVEMLQSRGVRTIIIAMQMKPESIRKIKDLPGVVIDFKGIDIAKCQLIFI